MPTPQRGDSWAEPIYSPERVARAIVWVLAKPRPELFIGPSRRAMAVRSPVRQWLERQLFAGGLVAAAASLQRSAAARRLGLRVADALGV